MWFLVFDFGVYCSEPWLYCAAVLTEAYGVRMRVQSAAYGVRMRGTDIAFGAHVTRVFLPFLRPSPRPSR
eukprot:3934206-Rhodomonas_salina.1